eukprot:9986040-Alexandrium_andersonii.AAC.1
MRHRQPQICPLEEAARHLQRRGQKAGASGRRLLRGPSALPPCKEGARHRPRCRWRRGQGQGWLQGPCRV